jgi:hypothetical protein
MIILSQLKMKVFYFLVKGADNAAFGSCIFYQS